MKEGKAMKETGIILVILGAMCALAAGAEWVAEHVPDWLWEPLFIMLLAGFVVWLGRWYYEAVEREAAEQEEGKDGNRKEAYPTDRR